ncbi:MAG: CYTH domain-containing protein [Lachnospiraceae bacterium]|nr:CYTH domain-containing protein [Lachnospiraceae bacterium]
MEIERKFLVKELPADLESYTHHAIEQGYLCTDPTVRIRKRGDKYTLTYKGRGLMEREEYNLPLNEEAYLHLREKTDGHLIKKVRYLIPLEDGLTAELDIFEYPKDLVIAEVEFKSREQADAFKPPVWFGADVTDDRKYHNSNMI